MRTPLHLKIQFSFAFHICISFSVCRNVAIVEYASPRQDEKFHWIWCGHNMVHIKINFGYFVKVLLSYIYIHIGFSVPILIFQQDRAKAYLFKSSSRENTFRCRNIKMKITIQRKRRVWYNMIKNSGSHASRFTLWLCKPSQVRIFLRLPYRSEHNSIA